MHLKPISREMRNELYRRNKYKRREDKDAREQTKAGEKGGYAGGFGCWSGVGDEFHDRDYGFQGRGSTQHYSKRKMDNIDRLMRGQEVKDYSRDRR